MLRTLPKSEQLPYALYRAEQVRELDRIAIEQFEIPGEVLMERAGQAAFALLRERWPRACDITVLAGIGNNGGDGFVLARLARQAGLTVRVLQLGDRESLGGDARLNAERWHDLCGEPGAEWLDFDGLPEHTEVIVDGIFGTGLAREVKGTWAAAIEAINRRQRPVLALDIPSGLHADTGAVLGVAVRATATLSFIGLKQGLFTGEGPARCGEVRFDGLEVPARVYAGQILSARRIDWRKQSGLLPPRSRSAHKGHFGHVLVVGGELGLGGAARLAAEAAARAGAGLVSLATRPEHVAAVLAARPEIMVRGIDRAEDLDELIARASVIAVGPGLGRGVWGRALWQRVLAAQRPLVIDADGLNLLAGQTPESIPGQADRVLTPHPGEAARLLGVRTAEVQNGRFDAARRLSRQFAACVVLKGAGSIVCEPGTRPPAVCSEGNPGMASGGMGDLLTGIVAALIAQGLSPGEAAECGVCLHAAAADAAAAERGERGLLAGDLLPWIQRRGND
jgi:NAD(P)H-hydrate epimerase